MNTPAWLSKLMESPEITDIFLNGPEKVFADCGEGPQPVHIPEFWSEKEMRAWILNLLSQTGQSWDAKNPFISTALPSGHRIHVAFPPCAQTGTLVSIRKLPDGKSPIQGKTRWQHSNAYPFLREIIQKGESLILSGSTGSGKTTLAQDLLGEVPHHERIIALEDTSELSPHHPHFLSLLSRPPNADGYGEVTLRELLKQTLRMKPDRIIIGECRGGEILELLQALNTGHKGALATLHANSPRDALRRIELLCLLNSHGSIPVTIIRELLAFGIQWIAQVRKSGTQNQRIISELWRLESLEGDTILMRPVIQQ